MTRYQFRAYENRHRNSSRRRVIFKLALLTLASGSLFAAQDAMPLPVRVTSESAPAGGTVQIKLFLDSPIAIRSGRVTVAFDPLIFGPFRYVSAFSATGDAYGTAEVRNGQLDIQFRSPSGGIGRLPDLPALTIEMPLLAAVSPGTVSRPNFSATLDDWQDLSGAPLRPIFSTALITVGGSLAIARLHPGAGLLPTGTMVQIEGTGFSTSTLVSIDGVATAPAEFVSATELRILLLAPADLEGKRVTVSNPDGATSTFYTNLQGTVDSKQTTSLPIFQPIFPRQAFTSTDAGGYRLMSQFIAVRNTQQVPVEVTFFTTVINNPSLTTKLIVAPGTSLIRNYGDVSAHIIRAHLYIRTSLPVQSLQIAQDSTFTYSYLVQPAVPFVPDPPSSNPPEPDTVTITAPFGSVAPLPRSAGRFTCTPSVGSLTTESGGPWLSISVTSNFYNFVTVSANPAGLAVGEYKGSFIVTCPGSTIPPTLRHVVFRVVKEFPTFKASQASLTMAVPAVQQITRTQLTIDTSLSPVDFTITSDSPWLTARLANGSTIVPFPSRFATPQALLVEANSTNLTDGFHYGNLTVTSAPASFTPPITIPVAFFVASLVPLPQAGPPLPVTVSNAASGSTGSIAPAEIVTIFGQNIGPDFPAGPGTEDTLILLNGIRSVALFASPTQTNVIVPAEIGAASSVLVEVERDGMRASAGAYPVAQSAPGIFGIVNQDGTLNDATHPAVRGSVIQIFATGAVTPVSIQISGTEVEVLYAGPAPAQIAGLFQVNVRIAPSPSAAANILTLLAGDERKSATHTLFLAATP